ncbi:hypothetical protein OIU74_014776 [Salix koriyanagi]|uniref:Uncharacterized protein n=1 Tax=Salix koriyanagi TaxID=2511006 RepID=A0A9Q0PWN1_9ROSI|nr:hypothetical protein OIU74_014776 [Salix koriyanagi]
MDVSDDEMDKEELQIETPENREKGFQVSRSSINLSSSFPNLRLPFLVNIIRFLGSSHGPFFYYSPPLSSLSVQDTLQ